MTEHHFILRDDRIIQNAIERIKSVKGNQQLHECILRPHDPNRSLDQNAMIHALFSRIATATGYSPAEIKAMCKRDILGSRIIERNGIKYEILPETRKMGKKEASEFIERIHVWCSENGIDV